MPQMILDKPYGPPAILGIVELVPYLGRTNYAPFVQLWGLYPESVREFAILSSVVVSVIAVLTARHASDDIEAARRYGQRAGFTTMLGFVFLAVLVFGFSERVDDDLRIAVGWSRVQGCPCPKGMSDTECLARITVAPEAVASCWSGKQRTVVTTGFTAGYLLVTGALGFWVGTQVLIRSLSTRETVD